MAEPKSFSAMNQGFVLDQIDVEEIEDELKKHIIRTAWFQLPNMKEVTT